jgi:hypothetical protein
MTLTGTTPGLVRDLVCLVKSFSSINFNVQILHSLDFKFSSTPASIARKIYLRQGIGVGGFQKIYGGRQRNGSRPPHFCKSSGAISRNILQQLQKMGIIDVDPKGYLNCYTPFSY